MKNHLQSFLPLDITDDTEDNLVMGSNDIMIDIDKKYVNILLFNERLNISEINHYLAEGRL